MPSMARVSANRAAPVIDSTRRLLHRFSDQNRTLNDQYLLTFHTIMAEPWSGRVLWMHLRLQSCAAFQATLA